MRTKFVVIILTLCVGTAMFIYMSLQLPSNSVAAAEDQENEQVFYDPLEVTIILERMYLDGEVSEEKIKETIWSMEDFWAKYDQWELVEMGDAELVFRQNVDDISPLLKSNGYFGITEDGILSIFNGKPGQSQIIQSFFQIDVQKLESRKREELLKGIPIMTKDRYEEVLETFKGYSKQSKMKN